LYGKYILKGVHPEGWMKRQLEIQANGLPGNLFKVWRDIKNSNWIGGDFDDWERFPYFLDGYIPLAYLSDNDDMKKRATHYVEKVMAGQWGDGWITPQSPEKRGGYDSWPVFLITKALVTYYEFTGIEAVLKSVLSAYKSYYEHLKERKIVLRDWSKARWFEAFVSLNVLYDKYKEPWIKDLGKILAENGTKWNEQTGKWTRPLNKWTYETHNVNIFMMLKYEPMAEYLLGGDYAFDPETMWRTLYKYNGTAAGIITGDECLSGLGASRGTELCGVAEFMYSAEKLYEYTGAPQWLDRLEKAAFNAFPATCSDDMWTHQYNQSSNQPYCVKFPGKSYFRTNGSEEQIFGLEPGYGCCTANMGQAWPKLAMSEFLRTEDGIDISILLPSVLSTQIDGRDVEIEVNSDYPFRQSASVNIRTKEKVDFDLTINVPSWAENVRVNGVSMNSKRITLDNSWDGEKTFEIEFDLSPELTDRPFGMKALNYGPFVFSLPIKSKWVMEEYEKGGVVRKYPYCDYEVYPLEEYNYAFASDKFDVKVNGSGDVPFSQSSPPVEIKTEMVKINWEPEDGYETVPSINPKDRTVISAPETKTLIPYGCAKLRMTEMPFAEEPEEQ